MQTIPEQSESDSPAIALRDIFSVSDQLVAMANAISLLKTFHQTLMNYRHILIGTIFAAAVTALYYLTGVDWSYAYSTNHMDSALAAYFIALAAALLPFGALLFLLRNTWQSKIFQMISFSAFCLLPIIAFWYWRFNQIRTDGWDFFIVPFWQLILVVALLTISSVIGIFSDQQPDT